jgi:hypothetical protein
LVEALRRFRFLKFDKQRVRQQALKFGKRLFLERIAKYVKEKYEEKFGRGQR